MDNLEIDILGNIWGIIDMFISSYNGFNIGAVGEVREIDYI